MTTWPPLYSPNHNLILFSTANRLHVYSKQFSFLYNPQRPQRARPLMDPYDQDPQAPGLTAMDTTPIPPPAITQPFMPQPLFPDSPMIFLPDQTLADFQGVSAPMQVMFSSPMEAIEPSAMLPPVSDFMQELGTMIDSYPLGSSSEKLDLSPATRTHSTSPPQSQVPSPSIHGSSSSYGAGVTSSLDSALDSASVIGGRSRANTSLSPPALPSVFSSGASDLDYPPSLSTSDLEESVSHKQPQTLIGQMLKG